MQPHTIVSREDWIKARKDHMAREKELTQARDALAEARRNLPWVKVDKDYVFEAEGGKVTFAGLFKGRLQLVVQHVMFAPDWDAACKSCSFWVDGFERMVPHLAARDTTMVAISRAPVKKLEAFKKRMGWTFDWFSSGSNDFNYDYGVSFKPEEMTHGKFYNYGTSDFPSEEAAGISVFYKDNAGNLFHTYSSYARGPEFLIGAYSYLDLVPKGRNEAHLPFTMAWVRHHDRYENEYVNSEK